jgi:hypothetical protein
MPETRRYGNCIFLRKEAWTTGGGSDLLLSRANRGKPLNGSFRVPQSVALFPPHVDVHCLFSETTIRAPQTRAKPENNKHYTHCRHNECQPSSYHQKPDSGCQRIHGPPTFEVRRLLGLMCLFSHDSRSGFSEFFLGFGLPPRIRRPASRASRSISFTDLGLRRVGSLYLELGYSIAGVLTPVNGSGRAVSIISLAVI